MATISNQPDAAMMAWYRAKKFGLVRPPYAAQRETMSDSLLPSASQSPPRRAG